MDMIEVAMVVLRGNLYSRWDHNEALFVVIFLLNASEDQGLACVCFKLLLSPITRSFQAEDRGVPGVCFTNPLAPTASPAQVRISQICLGHLDQRHQRHQTTHVIQTCISVEQKILNYLKKRKKR